MKYDVRHIPMLQARLARMQENMGWNDEGIYDRYWKRDVAELKKLIKILEKEQNKS